jgi:hypothetical protein
VREVAIVGCTIQHTADAPDSANIRCLGQSPETADKVGNLAVSDNVFSDAQWNIHLQFARGVTMTGNVFWHGHAGNLLVEHSSDIVIGPNLFDRNPDYGREDDGSTNALVFRECRDCTLTGLHINNTLDAPAALTLDRCRWFNVTGCTILDCDGVGLWLDRCKQCRVSGCLVRDERPTAGLTPREAVLVDTVRALFRTRQLTAAEFARAEAELGRPALIEVVTLAGYYGMVGLVLNAFEVELPRPDAG